MRTFQDLISKLKQFDYGHNYDGLLDAYSGVNVHLKKLRGSLGMATLDDTIYIDPRGVLAVDSDVFYFMLLHELAHFKRIKKMGVDFHLKQLSLSDFDSFFDRLINEEMIADRYASFVYYKLNKRLYANQTQNLHKPHKKEEYKPTARLVFGKIDNDMVNYNKLVETMFA